MQPEQIPIKNHYGNNSTTAFNFDFFIENEDQLKVTHTNLKGEQHILTYGVDYSINEFQNKNGSYIVFPLENSAYSVLQEEILTHKKEMLSIELILPFEQESEYDQNYLNFKNIEKSFDYVTRLVQILKYKFSKCISTAESVLVDLTLNSIIPNGFLKLNKDGTGLESYDLLADIEYIKKTNIIESNTIGVVKNGDDIILNAKTYVYTQAVASDTWNIQHDLNKYPKPTCIDSTGAVFRAAYEYPLLEDGVTPDPNRIIIRMNGATTGKCFLN